MPFKAFQLNVQEIFDETCIIFNLYLFLSIQATGYSEIQQYTLDQTLIGLYIINITVNSCYAIAVLRNKIGTWLRKKIKKWRER